MVIKTNFLYALPKGYRILSINVSHSCLGFLVTEEQLAEVAQHSGVLEIEDDFLPLETRKKCEAIIPFPAQVKPSECSNAYLYLNRKYHESQQL